MKFSAWHYNKLFISLMIFIFMSSLPASISNSNMLPKDYKWKKSYIVIIDSSSGALLKTMKSDSEAYFNPQIKGDLLLITRYSPGTVQYYNNTVEILNLDSLNYEYKSLSGIDDPVYDVERFLDKRTPNWTIQNEAIYYLKKSALFGAPQTTELVAKNWKNGEILWVWKERENEHFTGANFSDYSIFVQVTQESDKEDERGRIYSINKTNGKVEWFVEGPFTKVWDVSFLAATHETCVINNLQKGGQVIYAINAINGTILAKKEIKHALLRLEIIGGKPVVLGAERENGANGANFLINPGNWKELWRGYKASALSSFCADKENLFFLGNDKAIRIDPVTGNEIWSIDLEKSVSGQYQYWQQFCKGESLLISGGSDKEQNILTIDKNRGLIIKKLPLYSGLVADAFKEKDARLIVIYRHTFKNRENLPGLVVCYDTSNGKEVWKWVIPIGYKITSFSFSETKGKLVIAIGDPHLGVE